MFLLLLCQPEVKAVITLLTSIIVLVLSAWSTFIPSSLWLCISSSYLYIFLYCLFVVTLMRQFARGGQYKEISALKLTGHTYLITGAAGGIGKETACELAKRGARVVLFARSSKIADAIEAVKRVARSPEQISGYSLDLADLHSITVCANEFMKHEDK
jgi:hypothetical protein